MSNGAAVLLIPKMLLGIAAPNTPVAGDGTAEITLPALSLVATDYITRLPALTLQGTGVGGTVTDGTNTDHALPALLLSATGLTANDSSASLTLPTISVSAFSDSFASLALPKLQLSGSSLTGTDGSSAKELPALLLSAFANVNNPASANLSTAALVLVAQGNGGSSGSLERYLSKLGISAQGLTGADASVSANLPALNMLATGAGEITGTATLSLAALTLIANGSSSSDLDTYSAFTLNTSNNALTSYSNFNFNSFAEFNGVNLAAGAGGIYALTGTLDDTANITTNFALGVFDFESEQLKRVNELFFGYRANGDLTVRITLDDNDQYEYTLETTGQDGIYNNRLKLGRGLKARHWQIEVEGSGVDFEIANISADPQALSRRL